MKFYRIKALAERSIAITFSGLDPLVDFFYWPFYDIILWGFTGRWLQTTQSTLSNSSLAILAALVLWQASYRANMDVSFNLLNELWSRNIVNLFSTPITLSEWIAGAILVGLLNTAIAVTFGLFAVWLLYGIWILSLGFILIPLFISLIISGWIVGFVTASMLIYWGQSVQKLVWVMGWFFVPFCAVFYPYLVLPQWAKWIALPLPMTHVFEGLRSYIATNQIPKHEILVSFILNAIYFVIAIALFKIMFNKSRVKGLARLETE